MASRVLLISANRRATPDPAFAAGSGYSIFPGRLTHPTGGGVVKT